MLWCFCHTLEVTVLGHVVRGRWTAGACELVEGKDGSGVNKNFVHTATIRVDIYIRGVKLKIDPAERSILETATRIVCDRNKESTPPLIKSMWRTDSHLAHVTLCIRDLTVGSWGRDRDSFLP